MKIIIKYTLYVSVMIATIGCTSSHKRSLTKEFKESKPKINVAVLIPQKEIDARFHMPSHLNNSAIYSLANLDFVSAFLLALVEAYIKENIDKKLLEEKNTQLAPLRDSLQGFSIRDYHYDEVKKLINTFDWMEVDNVFKIEEYPEKNFSREHYTLKLVSFYLLSEDFQSIEFFTGVMLYTPKGYKPKKKISNHKVVFRNMYKYISPINKIEVSGSNGINHEKIEVWYNNELKKIKNLNRKDKNIARSKIIKEKKKRIREKNKLTDYSWQIKMQEIDAWYNKELKKLEHSNLRRKQRKIKKVKLSEERKERIKNQKKAIEFSNAEYKLAMSKKWAENNAQLAKKYLHEAVNETMKMIKFDLSDLKTVKQHKKDKAAKEYSSRQQEVYRSKDRVILRDTSDLAGQLCSIRIDMNFKRCYRSM